MRFCEIVQIVRGKRRKNKKDLTNRENHNILVLIVTIIKLCGHPAAFPFVPEKNENFKRIKY